MATPRLAGRKILPLAAITALLLAPACSTKKPPKVVQEDQTSISSKPGEGEMAGLNDPGGLEALAKYYEEAAIASGQAFPAEPTPAPNPLPRKIRGGEAITIGKVLVVHEGSRFVLIDTKAGHKPPPGATVAAHGITGVSSLRISKEQRRDFLSADILEGSPAAGDSVVWQR